MELKGTEIGKKRHHFQDYVVRDAGGISLKPKTHKHTQHGLQGFLEDFLKTKLAISLKTINQNTTQPLNFFILLQKCIKIANRPPAGQEARDNEDSVPIPHCDPCQAVGQKTINN